jgi:uncharacterized glyoxalase superfamily protein PhnB
MSVTRYDAKAPMPSSNWLALSETERLRLARNFHVQSRIKAPRMTAHAAIHVMVENQIAIGYGPTRRAVGRLVAQDFCAEGLAENFMMHILVEDVEAWRAHVQATGVVSKFDVRCTEIEIQPWRMRDFCLTDPSGVLWRIGQNTE